MANRANIPSSAACGQWETLLTDALDGVLKPEDESTFAAHMASCPACATLFDEARKGREWLEFLSPDPEVPAGLLDKILAQTGPGQVAGYGLIASGAKVQPALQVSTPVWQRPGFAGQVRRFAEPRLLMTAAMAFFSIALTLNLTGVRLSSLRMADLRPTAVRSFMERSFTTASVPIFRYYDHLRFAYEIESSMRELQRSSEGEEEGGDSSSPKQNDASPATPGESNANPSHKEGGSEAQPAIQQAGPQRGQQPARPAAAPARDGSDGLKVGSSDFLESSLTVTSQAFHGRSGAFRRLQNGTTGMEERERSTVWTA